MNNWHNGWMSGHYCSSALKELQQWRLYFTIVGSYPFYVCTHALPNPLPGAYYNPALFSSLPYLSCIFLQWHLNPPSWNPFRSRKMFPWRPGVKSLYTICNDHPTVQWSISQRYTPDPIFTEAVMQVFGGELQGACVWESNWVVQPALIVLRTLQFEISIFLHKRHAAGWVM